MNRLNDYLNLLFAGFAGRKYAPALVLAVLLVPLLAACAAPPAAAGPTSTATGSPTAAAGPTGVATGSPTAALRPVPVDHVGIEVGVGSPAAVEVLVSGTWPDLCAQLAETRQTIAGNRVEITLLATPADPSCPPDYLGLPFRLAVPLNVVEMPLGAYTIVVNGVSTEFDWQAGNTPPTTPVLQAARVDSVVVKIEGTRAVRSVQAVVSGRLENICAQVRQVNLEREGTTFWITVLADAPADAGCGAGEIPFELAIPLSMVTLPAGEYQVNANDVTAEFNPTVP